MNNKQIYVPVDGPESFKRFLAKPDEQWKTGYSAKALACSWCEADGFPKEIQDAIGNCGLERLRNLQPLFIVPEHKVDLPGGRGPSQNDLFVLARGEIDLISIAVEGKVREPFGDLVKDWLGNSPSDGKTTRLQFLLDTLGISSASVDGIRYQLLHRTVSALLEADRFNASDALMLIHSFSQEDEHFGDYENFLALFSLQAKVNDISGPIVRHDKNLYLGWVRGNKEYLNR